MAFVNELIPQEDIEKYGLVALCAEYSKDDSKYVGVQDPTWKFDWAIDREKEIWLIRMASAVNPDFKFPSPTQETIFILHYRGSNIEVRLLNEQISMSNQEIPYKTGWQYLSMNPCNTGKVTEEELKAIVKEAIQTYKELGIRGKRTTVTEITFFGFEE